MAHHYDERYRDSYRDERPGRDDRGFLERAGEEVRSWFGHDDERRSRHDESRYRPDRMASERHRSTERWAEPERWSREPQNYGERSYGSGYGYGDRWAGEGRWGQAARWRGESTPSYEDRWARSSQWGAWPYDRDTGQPERSAGWEMRSPGESRGIYESDRGRVYQFSHERDWNFAGRGPKNYRRSDDRIREDICERLTDDPRIDASEIEITVANGDVTLSGMVYSREEKRNTEELVERISGVRDVNNNLRVGARENTGRQPTMSTGTTAGAPSSTAPPQQARR